MRHFKRQQQREQALVAKLDGEGINVVPRPYRVKVNKYAFGESTRAQIEPVVVGRPLVQAYTVRRQQWTVRGLIVYPAVPVGAVTGPIRNAA